MDNVSFTSLIKPVSRKDFSKAISSIDRKNSVNYPWTIKDSVKASGAYTTGVCDCTVLGITDGKDVLMMHLCPANVANKENLFNIEIRRFLSQNIKRNNPDLQAILVGSRDYKDSQTLYEKLAEVVHDYNIPLSELKLSADNCSIDAAYSSKTDEWLIACNKIDKYLREGVKNSTEILKSIFKKVDISELDEIV